MSPSYLVFNLKSPSQIKGKKIGFLGSKNVINGPESEKYKHESLWKICLHMQL